jgi:hypothetical protein
MSPLSQPPGESFRPGVPPIGAPVRRPRSSKLRLALLIVLAVVVGNVGVIAVIYVIERSSAPTGKPSSVVNEFLTAVFTNRDADGALRLVGSTADQAEIRRKLESLRSPTVGGSPHVEWGEFGEVVTRDRAVVTVPATARVSAPPGVNQSAPGAFPTAIQHLFVFTLRAEHRQWRIYDWTF